MQSVNEHTQISKDINTQDDLDFSWLRDQGQAYIEQLSRKLWTDYNIHDPGITIMELMCYAITDLGLRINQPMEDLLATQDNAEDEMHKKFKSALQILTSKPVTKKDYRKLFIDIDGVKNVWLNPYTLKLYKECHPKFTKLDFKAFDESEYKTINFNAKGLYSLLVDYDKGVDKTRVNEQIHQIYHQNRNLCEDLVEIREVPKHCIRVCAEIQIDPNVDEEWIHAQIQFTINQYLSPHLTTFTLKELQDKGWTTDRIFDGPVLENGFITNEDLEKTNLRKEVRLSDLIKIIMKIDGVSLVEEIRMDNCPVSKEDDTSDCQPIKTSKSDEWIICIEGGHKPALCDKSTWHYKKGILPVGINSNKSKAYLEDLENEFKTSQLKRYEDLEMPIGEFTKVTDYQTIQHDLPENYGISPYGLSDKVPEKRKAQAKQLQGYLLFFDQILSVYFSHLGQVKDLLSGDAQLKRYYVLKAVKDVEGLDTLVGDTSIYETDPNQDLEMNVDGSTKSLINDLEDFKERRNGLIDHLLSRFAEVFEDYSSVMYKLFGKTSENDVLTTKINFLNAYDTTSARRGLAFNYRAHKEDNSPDVWDSFNVSGFQKRIALLSGIKDYRRKDLFNTHLSIEKFERTDGTIEYRWTIKDSSKTYLTSNQVFLTKSRAYQNLLEALKLACTTTHFTLETTTSGDKFYVVLTTAEYENDPTDKNIIGKQFNSYFASEDNANAEIEIVKEFIKQIQQEEGFYVIEHVLTLPYHKDEMPAEIQTSLPSCQDAHTAKCTSKEPFSYQLTIVFAGWTVRFSNVDFRKYMETLIRRELPAHISPKICWVGHMEGMLDELEDGTEPLNDMKNLQEKWKAFLLSKNGKTNAYMASINTTKDLWNAINELNSIYASGTLHDCENEETEERKNKIILNRSSLGTL